MGKIENNELYFNIHEANFTDFVDKFDDLLDSEIDHGQATLIESIIVNIPSILMMLNRF